MTSLSNLNNEHFLNFFQISPMPSLLLKPVSDSYLIVGVNTAYLKLMNVEECQLLNKDILAFFDKRIISIEQFSIGISLNSVVKNKIKNVSAVEPFYFAASKNQDSICQYWQIENTPSFSSDGEVDLIFHNILDKTKERTAELTLKEAELKAKLHFEINPYPMIVWDFETLKIVNVNERAIEKYGYTKEEFLQLDITQIRPVEDIPLIKEATQDVEHYGKNHKRIWRHLKKNGELMYIEVNANVTEIDGRVVSINHIQDVTERLIAENELKESEKKYAALFVSANDAIFLADAETRILIDANDKASQLIGRSRKEIIGMHQSQLHATEDLQYISEQFARFVSDDELKSIEVNVLHKDGHKIPVRISAGNTFNINGRKYAAAYFTDLTKAKEAESLIEKTSRLLKKAEEIAKIGSVEINVETQERLWSDGFKRIIGSEENNSVHYQNEFLEIIIPSDQDSHVNWLKKLSEGSDETLTNEIRINRLNDNQERILSIHGMRIKSNEGKTIKLFGVIRDVTDRKQLEADLLRSHNQLRKLTDTIPLGILQLDSAGLENPIISFVSKGIEGIHTGLTAKGVMENAGLLFDRIYKEDMKLVVDSSNNSRVNLTDVDIEFRATDIGDELKWIRLVYHPERNEDGSTSQYGYFQDITKEKMMLQALKDQNKELIEIAWIQSHIVRAPLAKLMGLSDLIGKGKITDNLEFFMSAITNTCNELDGIIREIVAKANGIKVAPDYINEGGNGI